MQTQEALLLPTISPKNPISESITQRSFDYYRKRFEPVYRKINQLHLNMMTLFEEIRVQYLNTNPKDVFRIETLRNQYILFEKKIEKSHIELGEKNLIILREIYFSDNTPSKPISSNLYQIQNFIGQLKILLEKYKQDISKTPEKQTSIKSLFQFLLPRTDIASQTYNDTVIISNTMLRFTEDYFQDIEKIRKNTK